MHAVNRSNVDDTGRLVGAGRLAQQRHQLLRKEEDALDVDVHYLVPTRFGEVFQRRAPCHARIVDQHVDLVLALGDLACEMVDAEQCAHV